MPAEDLQRILRNADAYRARARLNILIGTLSNARQQARCLDGLTPTRELILMREHLRTAEVFAKRADNVLTVSNGREKTDGH